MMFKKALFVVLGFVVFAFSSVYVYYQLKIEDVKPEIKKGFYPVDVSSSNPDTSSFSAIPFNRLLKDKIIIGFGEATHGTDEFRLAFKELTKALITDERVNMVVFAERDFGDSWLVNDFVLNQDDATPISLVLPYSSAQERELILWIKDFNKTRPKEQKVWVLGADVYTPRTAALNAIDFINKNKLTLPAKTLQVINDLGYSPVFSSLFWDKYDLSELLTNLKPLYATIAGVKTDQMTWAERLRFRNMQNLDELVKISALKKKSMLLSGLRDSLMYDNILWCMEQRPESKLLVFAHNAHLEKQEANKLSANNARLGWLLHKKFNGKYYAIASEVERGKYRSGTNQLFSIPEIRNKSGSLISKCVTDSGGFLDLHASEKLGKFFAQDRYITYGVLDTDRPTYPTMEEFSNAFDAVFWTRKSNPLSVSRPNSFNLMATIGKKKQPALFGNGQMLIKVNMSYNLFDSVSHIYNAPTLGVVSYSNEKFQTYTTIKFPSSKASLEVMQDLSPNVDSVVVLIAGDKTKEILIKNISINSSQTIHPKNMLYNAPNYEKKHDDVNGLTLSLKKMKN